MAEKHAAAGDRAFVKEDYQGAISHYSKALESAAQLDEHRPTDVYEARAYCHIKLQQWMDAVQDASKAVELDPTNAKAHLRKGMACYKLEEFETALDAFEAGEELVGDKNPQYGIWAQKCRIALAGDDYVAPTPTQVVTTVHVPPAPPTPAPKAEAAASGADKPAAPSAAASQAAAAPAAASASAQAAAESFISDYGFSKSLAPVAVEEYTGKYRHQWYQLGNKVVIDVYAKGLPQDAVTVKLSGSNNDKLNITIASAQQQQQQPASTTTAAAGDDKKEQSEEGDYVLELDLFEKVAADTPVKVEVLRAKVEITLVKANSSIHWHTLEKGKGPAAAGVGVAAAPAAPAAPAAAGAAPNQQQQQAGSTTAANVRQYPSSKGPKDWSKVEAELKELEEKGELEDGDPLNNFFKKIFAQGDEDTRRAMMKSFVESNGTVLSTNWEEVGSKPVEFKTPDGADVKKWDI